MPHGHSRLGGAGGRSTPSSPPSSPRSRHGRSRSFGGGGGRWPKKSLVERLVLAIVSAVFRRRGVLLFAPVLYITGMVLYMGSFGFDVGLRRNADGPAPPGSVYRSPQVFEKLWPLMETESNSSFNALTMAWSPTLHQSWKPCGSMTISQTGSKQLPESNGFLIIEANGGLNQQRLSICDAVAVAGLLNATLVIPIFHLNSVWQDSSNFSDIFDEDFFIDSLKNNVKIVRELPEDMLQRFDYNISSIVNLRVKAWSSPNHYLEKVLRRMKELG